MSYTRGKLKVRSSGEVGTERTLVACVYPMRTDNAKRNIANAKRIVHCWNTHDRLVQALKAARDSEWSSEESLEYRIADLKSVAEQALVNEAAGL